MDLHLSEDLRHDVVGTALVLGRLAEPAVDAEWDLHVREERRAGCDGDESVPHVLGSAAEGGT